MRAVAQQGFGTLPSSRDRARTYYAEHREGLRRKLIFGWSKGEFPLVGSHERGSSCSAPNFLAFVSRLKARYNVKDEHSTGMPKNGTTAPG